MNKKISSLLPLFFLFSFWGFSQTVFINEINHFDAGSKGVEIAGPAGTDIGGWSLVLYDLNGAVITTQPIASMIIPDLQNTYGFIWIDVVMGLQSNDGAIGLVDNMGQPVQFVSYGGTITAVGGLFFGLTSENAGQQTVAGETLQLTGTGNVYPDFTWDNPGTFTKGLVNTNQSFITNPANNAALPVDLLFFNGKLTDGKALLAWATATEINNDYFRVEHSRNGKDFREITEVSGVGYSTETVQYDCTHANVARGINYYRLVQVDFNGAETISDVITISVEMTEPVVNVYPNPTSDRLTVQMPLTSANQVQVRLFDNMGRVVMQTVFSPENALELQVAHLPKGTYTLHLNNSETTHNQLVIIK